MNGNVRLLREVDQENRIKENDRKVRDWDNLLEH